MIAPLAVPLFAVAAGMSLTVPAVIEYFRNQKGIDLSGYGNNDLVPYDILYPETESERIKTYTTYDDSFTQPVTAATDLSGIIVESKKDDKEVKKTIDQEGKILPDLPDQMPEPPEDPDWKFKVNWKRIAEFAFERVVDKEIKNLEQFVKEKVGDIEKQGLTFPKEKTDNNVRLHKMRLQNILDGKVEAYPGDPKNNRTVLQPPEGSDLPPIAIGNITFQDWTDKIIGNQETILEDANWYGKVFDSFDVMTNGDKKRNEILAEAWLAGQINLSPVNSLANVIYIHEQWKRGVPFEDVRGKGLPVAVDNVKSIIYGKKMEGGAGQKISDFIDSGYGNTYRAIMGHNSEGGQPFVVDIHTGRDTGLVDQKYLNHLKKLGYVIPEGIEIDFKQGIQGTKYENRALWGQDLTRYLNDENWMGKNDWTPLQVQAVGWMNLTRMYGESGDINMALNRNLRRIAMEVDPGEGSPWQLTYGEKYNALDDEKKFKINELVTKKAIDFVNELTGIDFSSNVHGTGGWELIQNPSTVQQAYASQEAAEEAAALFGLFNNQTEILVSSAKELTKNPQNYSLFIIEDGSTNLRDSNTLKGLFERIINKDPAGLFRGYQPIMVNGEPGIQIIIDKDTISKAIDEKRIKRADILPYIQEFSANGLADATKDLDFAVKNYISEANVKKIVNDWTKQKNGQSFIDNISEKYKSIAEDTGKSTIDYFREQLTKYLAKLLQEESKTITDETVKKLTKKKFGGTINMPTFYYGGFIDVNRL